MASFSNHVLAVARVEQRLARVTAALDSAAIPYAVVGECAAAAWVGRVDPSATRATKDVDLLVRRSDVDRITKSLTALGFQRLDMRSLVMFIDPDEPSKRAGVHLVWSDELIRTTYTVPAPSVDEAVRDPAGFLVLGLAALVRMKLTSFRDIDRVHVGDMLEVGLVDDAVRKVLPPELLERLEVIERSRDDS